MFSKFFGGLSTKKVRVKLQTPSTFNWGKEVMPVTLMIVNKGAEARTVNGVLFELREKEESESEPWNQDWSRGNSIRYEHDLVVMLDPGEERLEEIEIPISLNSMHPEGEAVPEWMKSVSKAVGLMQRARPGSRSFELRASVKFDEFSSPVRKVRAIGGGLTFGR